jgi:type IV secretion system protein TrbE
MPVYEEYLPPKRKADLLSDAVPWRNMILPGLILQKKQHGLQRSYRVRGPDLQGVSPEEQGALMLQANEVLKRLGGQWMLQSEAQRTQVKSLPKVSWPLIVPELIDEEHRATLLGTPGSRETRYFLTLSWVPPMLTPEKGLRFLIKGPPRPTTMTPGQEHQGASLREFLSRTDFFIDLLKGMLAQCRALDEVETLTYLHNCVSDRWYPVGPLASYLDIDHQLCDTDLGPAGWYPQLGCWHIRTCSVLAYPAQSLAGMMRALDALGIDFRWCSRWLGMEKYVQEGILRGAQRAWIGEETSFMDRTVENMTKEATRVRNTTATLHAEGIDAARQEIGMDVVAYGEFTGTVTVWDDDPDLAEAKRTLVMEAFANQGFTAHAESWHQTGAWFSSFPGDRTHNVHKSTHNTLTLAHLMPGLTATWPGPERDEYLKAGPWFYAQTEFTNLFRVVNHLRDLGHFLLLGATRSGKSTLGNFMRAMWMQYRHAQAKVFDVDGHARLLTYLLGGYWHDLGDPRLRLQPLRTVDDPLRQAVLLQWLLDLLEMQKVTVNAYAQMYVSGGLKQLAQRRASTRTWEEFLRILAAKPEGYLHEVHNHRIRVDALGVGHEDVHLRQLDQLKAEVRWALQRYATVFGGDTDTLPAHPVQTFELRSLTKQSQLLGPMMRYIMLEVSHQMTTEAPMFLLLDDAAIAWLAPKGEAQRQGVLPQGRKTMEEQADDWLQTTAKKGVSLGVSTHSAEKILQSPLGQIMIESCKHRYYLPNPGATEKHIRAVYAEMGLTDTAIQTIAASRPQRDVYYAHEELGQRLISLAHGPLTLDCIARNAAEDHALMDTLLQQEGREGFAAAWFRHHGYPDAAQRVEAWWQRRREQEERLQEQGVRSRETEGPGAEAREANEETLSVGE